eukprot:6885333-Pyramimonas_sp.AAC.1
MNRNCCWALYPFFQYPSRAPRAGAHAGRLEATRRLSDASPRRPLSAAPSGRPAEAADRGRRPEARRGGRPEAPP